MFSLGLEFSLRKLRKVGFAALIAAALEILLMVWVGYEIGRAFGWKTMDCIFLGAMLSISSTTIIVKALGELGRSKEKFAELIFGILIVEDILAIVMIALLSGIAMTGSLAVGEVFNTTARLGIFLVVSLVLGLLAVPRLLGYVARFKSNEMLLVTVLGLCFGVSLLAVKLNYSVALGAFVIGAVIAEAREIHRIEILTEPLRDMFSAVFFVAIGLLIDPRLLAQHWLPVVVITLAVVLGKVVTCAFGAFVAGNDTRTSLRVGMGLAQIGEFSFIIASLGLTLRVTSEFLYPDRRHRFGHHHVVHAVSHQKLGRIGELVRSRRPGAVRELPRALHALGRPMARGQAYQHDQPVDPPLDMANGAEPCAGRGHFRRGSLRRGETTVCPGARRRERDNALILVPPPTRPLIFCDLS